MFTDIVIVCAEDPKHYKPISELSKGIKYKIKVQKSTVFLHTMVVLKFSLGNIYYSVIKTVYYWQKNRPKSGINSPKIDSLIYIVTSFSKAPVHFNEEYFQYVGTHRYLHGKI